MREVDRRVTFDRRRFLHGVAVIPPAVAVAARVGLPVGTAWADTAKALKPETMQTLARMARDIYPHDHLSDLYYIAAVTPWDDKAAKDDAVKALVEDGVARLDQDAQDRHGSAYAAVAQEEDRTALLRGIEQTAFFKKLRSDLVVSLYNQPDLWPLFGYEGSSADKGGYIHRGFGDIDWLPGA
ncbi:gluconate 2-dehydrogenase subunit 3 family protein [Inquilinus sp. CA228]|uniref:gluconate 2-dehydrogenase subunit 3 family protein n=1 Tax=Inquilinus sp. CA228 TaxID=3455609 RepID=UPI003F8D2B35